MYDVVLIYALFKIGQCLLNKEEYKSLCSHDTTLELIVLLTIHKALH